ncbi:hypothetical protein GCM10010172_77880 [Paractinoplanes ferrugineus]|uniref:Gamma-glutamylcyclotransferase n=1 Tax=Paractinoplanes ferrugineus TaxID=113564 RepID=A0A919J952_9ACTN|nr:gamma-glutamylcyclotransferase family protein [Actinoplanes ferrugineus]GIE12861.1 hypothetical protein Afe05nite_47010 [Actinoplanes ferrugineus]
MNVSERDTCGVFVYGSVVSAAALAATLGEGARDGVHFGKATLAGWRRRWNVCTDNTVSRAVRYHTPGTTERPPVQVLFLNIVPADPRTVLTGYLLLGGPDLVAALDAREGNYDRADVTHAVVGWGGLPRPATVWAYVGKPASVRTAEAGLSRGSARIRREYLDVVAAAFAPHSDLTAELRASLTPLPARIEPLTRVVAG